MSPVRPLLRLDNPVKAYAWGSRTFLAALDGRATPSAEPEAERWMGAHPSAPSRVRHGDREVGLDELIRDAPGDILGRALIARHGATLPFLFKLLAAAEPLSLQVHPNPAQARDGYAREEEAAVPRGARERSYPDSLAKPELVYALAPFVALHGFREPREIAAWVERLRSPVLEQWIAPARSASTGEALREMLRSLVFVPPPERAALARAARDAASRLGDEAPELRWVSRLAARYPEDPTVLAPLLLNLVELAPGQALFTDAGVVHCYLEGAAVELQASSDNVVRAGLTEKHVDAAELLRLARFEPTAPRILDARAGDTVGVLELHPSPPELVLQRLELGAGRRGAAAAIELDRSDPDRGPDVLLCTRGEALVEAALGDEAHRERLLAGQSLLVTAAATRCRVSGDASLLRASMAVRAASPPGRTSVDSSRIAIGSSPRPRG